MKDKLVFQTHYFGCIGSTNTTLKSMAREGSPEGTVVISKRQTAGRGRLGRSFFSEDGCGIYLSLLLRPDMPIQSASLLTCLAAVAVIRTLKPYSDRTLGIKWVNDIYLGEKKVCGILTESAATADGRLEFAVIGIGINLCAPAAGFPDSISDIATALFEDERQALNDRNAIIDSLLSELSALYETFDTGDFIDEYIFNSILIGKDVNLIQGCSIRPCKVIGIDKECRLEVEFSDGKTELVSHGEAVSIKPL